MVFNVGDYLGITPDIGDGRVIEIDIVQIDHSECAFQTHIDFRVKDPDKADVPAIKHRTLLRNRSHGAKQ